MNDFVCTVSGRSCHKELPTYDTENSPLVDVTYSIFK